MVRGIAASATCAAAAWPSACRAGSGQHVEDEASLVDRTPEPVLHTTDPDCDLVEVPLVTRARQPAADLIGKGLAEPAARLLHCFVTDHDATESRYLFHHAQTQREAEVKPHRMASNFGRESMPGQVGAGGGDHPTRLPGGGPLRQADHLPT